MPLIILSGIPSSGKSFRSQQLKDYFESQHKTVHLISENAAIHKTGHHKNEIFADSQKEKILRGDLKSDTLRLLNKEDVIILDGGNYIKGYRYEIYCASKSVRVNQCTIWCAAPKNDAWEFNLKRPLNCNDDESQGTQYSKEIFDALCLRFEEPNGNNRWDSPLFIVLPGDDLPCSEISAALFEKAPPKPNQSTQNVCTHIRIF